MRPHPTSPTPGLGSPAGCVAYVDLDASGKGTVVCDKRELREPVLVTVGAGPGAAASGADGVGHGSDGLLGADGSGYVLASGNGGGGGGVQMPPSDGNGDPSNN